MRCGLVAQAPVHGAAEDPVAAGGEASAGTAGDTNGRASAAARAMSRPTARRAGRFPEVTELSRAAAFVGIDALFMSWMLLEDVLKRNQASTFDIRERQGGHPVQGGGR
jgi:hypothetical protein